MTADFIGVKPKRIQRKRSPGWRMPDNAVYVGRPSKWGNPYWDIKRYGLILCLKLFSETAQGIWDPASVPEGLPYRNLWLSWLYKDHQRWMKVFNEMGMHPVIAARQELRGRDLACWCPLDQECHSDILLEIANS